MHSVPKSVLGTLKSIKSKVNFRGTGHEERRMYISAYYCISLLQFFDYWPFIVLSDNRLKIWFESRQTKEV